MADSEHNVLHKPSGTKVRVMSRQQGGLECTVMWPCGSIAAMSPNDLQFPTPSNKVVRAWGLIDVQDRENDLLAVYMNEGRAKKHEYVGFQEVVPLIGIEGYEPKMPEQPTYFDKAYSYLTVQFHRKKESER